MRWFRLIEQRRRVQLEIITKGERTAHEQPIRTIIRFIYLLPISHKGDRDIRQFFDQTAPVGMIPMVQYQNFPLQ